jgi:methylated-DNA-[protein]-cysteine S-methyltransferase
MPSSIYHDTPLGCLEITATVRGVSRAQFVDDLASWSTQGELIDPTSMRASGPTGHWLVLARDEIDEYFAGSLRIFSVPVDQSDARAFNRKVYEGLESSAPYGTTTTYGALADAIGLDLAQ